MSTFDPTVVAYTERDSIDPMTCEEGKLRREWSVAVTPDPLPAELNLSGRITGWDEFMLLVRYVRRGTIEPWTLMDFYPTEDAALRDIGDSGVVPVDPRLVTIFREREWAQRVEEAKRAAESEKALKREAHRLRAALGARAYGKLLKGGRPADVELCEKWNAFVSDPENVARRDELAKDSEFMKLYYAALYADRVPEKRKVMKEFFKYVEAKYGWKAENVNSLKMTDIS